MRNRYKGDEYYSSYPFWGCSQRLTETEVETLTSRQDLKEENTQENLSTRSTVASISSVKLLQLL